LTRVNCFSRKKKVKEIKRKKKHELIRDTHLTLSINALTEMIKLKQIFKRYDPIKITLKLTTQLKFYNKNRRN